MKTIRKWIAEIFDPAEIQGLNIDELVAAMNDFSVRNKWFLKMFEDLKSMNLEVDRKLKEGREFGLSDLCARRRAYQDMLESVLEAKRAVLKEVPHNPPPRSVKIDLDRVTE